MYVYSFIFTHSTSLYDSFLKTKQPEKVKKTENKLKILSENTIYLVIKSKKIKKSL